MIKWPWRGGGGDFKIECDNASVEADFTLLKCDAITDCKKTNKKRFSLMVKIKSASFT